MNAHIGHNGGPALEDRWYQLEAVDRLFDYYGKPRTLDAKGYPVRKNPLICLPTGTGKSIVIAKFLQRAFSYVPGTRVIMATHVKELISQNARKLLEAWPLAPLGIYSAGLKSRDHVQPIIFGGIQSLVGKYPMFGHRDFLVIDEAHLLADEGSYLEFIKELLQTNPYLKVIGLTATPYRLGLGLMTNGSIFSDIVFDLTDIDGFNRLIAEGFLCPLIPKRTQTQLDTSGVGMNRGEFAAGELERAVDKHDVTVAALREVVTEGQNRRSWLAFASGINHAEHICEILNNMFGVSTVVIHSKKSEGENERALRAWKSGEVRCAVNMNALTTGVDHPALDLIAMLRPTMSTGLWVQMLGRGTRPYAGKDNCLVLDFAGNTRRLGPINDPVIPRLKGQGSPGDAPVKICPTCGVYNHASARFCIACGTLFVGDPKLDRQASTEELLRSDLPQIEMFDVMQVVYAPHTSKAGNNIIKASYFCNQMRTFYEYITVEGELQPDGSRKYRYPAAKGRDWFRQRLGEPPDTNAEVLQVISQLRAPRQIRVWVNAAPFPSILGAEF